MRGVGGVLPTPLKGEAMGNDGIVISDTVPVGAFKATWLRILPDGSREWYELVGNDWTPVKTEAAPALASHTHSSLNLDVTEDHIRLRHIKVVNGVITELEYD